MENISAVIIAKNEEKNIRRCLNSVRWADEVVVVDTGSSDGTPDIVRQMGARLFEIEWAGYGRAKNFAADQAKSKWILSLDADEEISESLAAEIKDIITSDTHADGYFIPRRTLFLGRWIKHSRWYPDYVLRLYRREKGEISLSAVHEKISVNGETARLKNPIHHYSYPDVSTFLGKFEKYSSLGAEKLHQKGVRFSVSKALLSTLAAFYRHYISGAGFLDGVDGFLIAVLSASGTIAKYRKLRKIEKDQVIDQSSSH